MKDIRKNRRWEDEEEDVSCYCMTLRKRRETAKGNTRSHLWRTRFGRGYGHVVRQTTE